LKRASFLISGIAGATIILAAACGGAAPPTNTPAPPTPAATSAPAPITPPGGNGGGDLVAQGQTLYETAQPIPCMTCHTRDGSPSAGPTWQGIYGSEETLTDGTTVTVDDEYIQESIVDPNAKIVEGFQPDVMPQGYGDTLSESDIEAIIAYIKSLQ
jgi:mono/diheme cytochrome c family protein